MSRNKEKKSEYNRQWRMAHPGYAREWYAAHPEKCRERNRKLYAAHPEKYRERDRERYATHPEECHEAMRKWRATHPEEQRIHDANHRARELQNGGRISTAEWKDLLAKYSNKCLCCGRDDTKLSLDHIVPLVFGGVNTIENAQPLCKSCNSKKHTKIIDYRKF